MHMRRDPPQVFHNHFRAAEHVAVDALDDDPMLVEGGAKDRLVRLVDVARSRRVNGDQSAFHRKHLRNVR